MDQCNHASIYFDKNVPQSPFIIFNNDKLWRKAEKTYSKNNHANNCKFLKARFYSKENIENIQKLIQKKVYDKLGFKSTLSNKILINFMEQIFDIYSENFNTNMTNQINKLNNIIASELTPKIIFNYKSNKKFLQDKFGKRKLIGLPTNNSNKGNNILPSWLN